MNYENVRREISVYVQELDCWVKFEYIYEIRQFIKGYMKLSRVADNKGRKVKVAAVGFREYHPGRTNLTIILLDEFDEKKYWADAMKERDEEQRRLMEASA